MTLDSQVQCSQSHSLSHCAGDPPPATKFWALSVTNHTSAPLGCSLSGFWGSLGNGHAAIRVADAELTVDSECLQPWGGGKGG